MPVACPRLLNGAQTVTTVAGFGKKIRTIQTETGKAAFESSGCSAESSPMQTKNLLPVSRLITTAESREPWNLYANDLIQLEFQDKFRSDIGLYYERQENVFEDSLEDLDE